MNKQGKHSDLCNDLRVALSSHSIDSLCNTSDYILADYLIDCINTWIKAKQRLDIGSPAATSYIER